MRILQKALGLITQNFWWKMLSLAIAITIWGLVASEGEMSTFATARVELKNLPEDLEIASEPVSTVLLELTGPSAELRSLGNGGQHPEVVVDLANLTPGQHTFSIGENNVKLTRGVHILLANPSQVRFDFEPHLERRVPVRVRLAGAPSKGYVVASATVEPAELEIAGPRSHVARVDSVVTDSIGVPPDGGASTYRVNAFVNDPFVRFVSAPDVTVTVTEKKQ
jgi:YbbR domain-containing protein